MFEETPFTAFLLRMLRKSQHTCFEDQILGQISLWGRPASCASLITILIVCKWGEYIHEDVPGWIECIWAPYRVDTMDLESLAKMFSVKTFQRTARFDGLMPTDPFFETPNLMITAIVVQERRIWRCFRLDGRASKPPLPLMTTAIVWTKLACLNLQAASGDHDPIRLWSLAERCSDESVDCDDEDEADFF